MESIKIWFNGKKNYDLGVKLYLQFGDNDLLKRLFQEKPPTPFKIQKLHEALEDLLIKPEKSKQAEPKKETVIVSRLKEEAKQQEQFKTKKIYDAGWSKDMDEVEQAIHLQWKPVFLEMMELCSKVGDVAREGMTDPYKEIAAGKMALRILDLDDQCDELYSQRDHYLANGSLPDQRPYGDPCIDPKLMPVKLKNAERYVRRLKNELRENPENLKAAENLKKHEWFVAYYKKELNID